MRSKRTATFDTLKRDLAVQIMNLSDGDTYELIALVTDKVLPFLHEPAGSLSCKECKEIYGKCRAGEDDGSIMECKEKFMTYHASAEKGIAY